MHLKELEYVLTISRYSNLTRAAEVLGVTQSTLSHILKRLELEYGIKLFRRGNGGFIPTPAGEIFLENSKKMLTINNATKKRLADLQPETRKVLNIGAPPLSHLFILPPYLIKLKQGYPNLKVNLVAGDADYLQDLLEAGMLDCATLPRVKSSKLEKVFFCSMEVLVAMPLNNPLTKDYTFRRHHLPDMDFAKLRNEQFIMLNGSHPCNDLFKQLCKKNHISPKIDMEFNSFYSIISIISKGFGVSLLPEAILNTNPELIKNIAFFRLKGSFKTFPIFLTYPKNTTLPMAALELLDSYPRTGGNRIRIRRHDTIPVEPYTAPAGISSSAAASSYHSNDSYSNTNYSNTISYNSNSNSCAAGTSHSSSDDADINRSATDICSSSTSTGDTTSSNSIISSSYSSTIENGNVTSSDAAPSPISCNHADVNSNSSGNTTNSNSTDSNSTNSGNSNSTNSSGCGDCTDSGDSDLITIE